SKAEFNSLAPAVPEIRYTRGNLHNLAGYWASGDEVAARSGRSKIDDFLWAQGAKLVVLIDLKPVDIRREPIGPTPPAMLGIARPWRPHRSKIIDVSVLWFQMGVTRRCREAGDLHRPRIPRVNHAGLRNLRRREELG